MTVYTMQWECPLCDMSRTRLRQYKTPSNATGSISDLEKSATSGLLTHIRKMTDDTHGGRGNYPTDEWSIEFATAFVSISAVTETA